MRPSAPPSQVEPGFAVRVASLPGLAILKLLAWADRGAADPRDAIDLAMLLRQYSAAGNADRLYGAEMGMFEALGYDPELAGARLLGRDAGRISGPTTRARLLTLLDDGGHLERLARAMARQMGAVDDATSAATRLIHQLRTGLGEI